MIKANEIASMVIGIIIGIVLMFIINAESYSKASFILGEFGHVEYQKNVLIYTSNEDFLTPSEIGALETLSSEYEIISIKNGRVQ